MSAKPLKYKQRVVVVLVVNGIVDARTGFICSHRNVDEVDNKKETIVWGDRPFLQDMDNVNDAHEKYFRVKDPHLLTIAESRLLQNEGNAYKWFEVYSPDIVCRISKALRGLHQ